MHFAHMPSNAFTVHGLLRAASPLALGEAITTHVFDPVRGEVPRKICVGNYAPTYYSVFVLPFTETGRPLGGNKLLPEGKISSAGQIQRTP